MTYMNLNYDKGIYLTSKASKASTKRSKEDQERGERHPSKDEEGGNKKQGLL
jgi:hypothetical protein